MRQLHQSWRLGFLMLLSAIALMTDCANAQVIPDQTLGSESSTLQNERIRGRDGIERESDLIEGGARRGGNLFHSFEQFDVMAGRGAYFANPDEVANILSRVTGGDRSEIFGTLGVLGSANLFLINPNGVLFGSNASLDIQGSFAATTANGVQLGDQGFFSATSPEQSSLLEVNPGAFLFNQAVAQGGAIASTGNLTAGQDLTLSGLNLDLQGQLRAGRNLTLYGADTVRIRDSALNPFVAAAGGQLLVQGDRTVDIFALSHPSSGLFSGGDMVLRSANQVGGDAHYWSGGNFRIERSDGSLGDLYSPYDPVIRVVGDLELANYSGASLHILAGGSVTIPGAVFISGSDTTGAALAETVTLSNGVALSIDGTTRPTVDIRAGVDLASIGSPLGLVGDASIPGGGTIFDVPTSAEISIGYIDISQPDGLVYLTNQYQPNSSLAQGNISINQPGLLGFVRGIRIRSNTGNGGSVVIDSRANIALAEEARVITNSSTGKGGDVQFIAGGNITLDGLSNVEAYAGPIIDITSDDNPVNNNRGGNISLNAGGNIVLEGSNSLTTPVSLLTNGGGNISIQGRQLLMGRFSVITSETFGNQEGGNISIQATDAVRVNGGNIGTFTFPAASARGGNIIIKTGELTVTGAAEPDDSILGGFSTGGDITSETGGRGSAGSINIDARQLRVIDGAQIRASTLRLGNVDGSGTGNAGNITITAPDGIEVIGSLGNNISKIATSVNGGATGRGGSISIETNHLSIRDEAQIQAGAFGAGHGGSVTINAPQSIEIVSTTNGGNATGILTGPEGSRASGDGGNLNITTGLLTLRGDGAQIANEVDSESTGNSGSTVVNVDRLSITEGGLIRTGTLNTGQGGNLQITASDSVELSGVSGTGEDEDPSGIFVGTFGLADAGDLTLTTSQLTIRGGAAITASTVGIGQDSFAGTGRGGDITIDADRVEISGRSAGGFSSSIVSEAGSFFGSFNPESRAPGGNIHLTTGQLTVQDGAVISTQTFGAGNAGNLTIGATRSVQLSDGDLRSRTSGAGNAGSLSIIAGELTLRDGEATSSTDGGGGRGGDISVTVQGTTELIGDKAGLAASSFSSGDAGSLTLRTNRLIVRDGAGISTESIGQEGRAGDLTIISPNAVEVIGGAFRTGAEANAPLDDATRDISPFDLNQTYFFPSRISAAVVSTLPNTPAANLSISTDRLTVSNGGEISTETIGTSLGGQLSVNASQINITGSSGNLRSDIESTPSALLAQTFDTGNSGDIQLNVNRLQVADGALISAASVGVSSDGRSAPRGTPGNIFIRNSDSVFLRTNGTISTEIEPRALVSSSAPQSGNIQIQTRQLSLSSGARITASTSGQGTAGNISISNANTVNLDRSTISSTVNLGAIGNGGNINLQTDRLNLDRSNITASTSGQGNAGNIIIRDANTVNLDRSTISTAVGATGVGRGGNITLNTGILDLTRSNITSSTNGQGNTGTINLNATSGINLRSRSRITNSVEERATGNARTIRLNTPELSLQGNSLISAATDGNGRAGNVIVPNANTISLSNSRITNQIESHGIVPRSTNSRNNRRSNITLNTDALTLTNNARITANTQGRGNAGNIIVSNSENIDLTNGSTISTAVQQGARGRGGNINLTSDTLNLDNARITARTAAPGRAGNIAINASDSIAANNSTIETRSNNSSSGNVAIAASTVQLQGNSDIRTQVNRGEGRGGNIALTADSVIAFDDSDIVTRAPEGQGGNITFNTPAFFGDGYQPNTPETRNNNDRVDVDASGVQSGIVTTPDVSFIQNSLADLSDNATDPETLLANSCIVRDRQQGRFTITGSGGLPERPGNATQSAYPTGTIQSVPESESRGDRPWQMGDAIVEPQGVYLLPDGRLVMGRECSTTGS